MAPSLTRAREPDDSSLKRRLVKDRETGHNVGCMARLARLARPAAVIGLLATLGLAVGCRAAPAPPASARYDPAHDLGPLFQDVQLAGIFPDSKTFVDARPVLAPAEIVGRYATARGAAAFSLRHFV